MDNNHDNRFINDIICVRSDFMDKFNKDKISEHHSQRTKQYIDNCNSVCNLSDTISTEIIERNNRHYPADERKQRRSGRMRNSHYIGTGNEFTAVPERNCRSSGHQIYDSHNGKYYCGNNFIYFFRLQKNSFRTKLYQSSIILIVLIY